MKLTLEPGERLLKIDEARLSEELGVTRGVLCLTTWRLLFVAADGRTLAMAVDQIEGLRAERTLLGLLQRGLVVVGPLAREERFALSRPAQWIALIERVRAGEADALPDAPTATAPTGPIEPVVSWPAVMAWIAAPLALVPFLGLVPTLVLAFAAGRLLTRPRRRLDRTVGVVAAVLATLAFGALGLEVFGLLRPSEHLFSEGGGARDLTTLLKVMQVVVLVFSIVLHECGHALAAYWSGDDTSVRRRRLTLNPIPHIDLFGSIVLPGILIFSGSPAVFGWAKPVPIDLANLRNRFWGNLAVSLAGVSANLLLAMIAMSLLLALGLGLEVLAPEGTSRGFTDLFSSAQLTGVPASTLWVEVADVLKMTIIVNLVLFAFNLLPVPPLDGSHVLETVLPRSVAALYARLRPFGMILLVLLIFTGATRWVFGGVITLAYLFLGLAGALCGIG